MNHKFIIGFKEVYKTRGGKICIVMDHADGGDLQKAITKAKTSRSSIPEETILNWFTQI
jgi:NIMA (never in mitosis gene a)-related kinase